MEHSEFDTDWNNDIADPLLINSTPGKREKQRIPSSFRKDMKWIVLAIALVAAFIAILLAISV